MGDFEINETWLSISGYEGLYEISNLGNVKSLARLDRLGRTVEEKILKTINHTGGYLKVSLSKDNEHKKLYIHRLVANAFIPNDSNLPEVNHKDGNKKNNHISNLEWVTYSENIKHAFKNGLNKSPKAMLGKFGKDHNRSKGVIQYDLNGNIISKFGSILEASRETGVNTAGISECCRGNYKKSGGYIWRYDA